MSAALRAAYTTCLALLPDRAASTVVRLASCAGQRLLSDAKSRSQNPLTLLCDLAVLVVLSAVTRFARIAALGFVSNSKRSKRRQTLRLTENRANAAKALALFF